MVSGGALRAFGCLALLSLAACASDSARSAQLANPGFETAACPALSLCDWTVDGEFASVATWHPSDRGILLGRAPVSVTQLLEPWHGGACARLDVVADVAPAAAVVVELDFDADGSVEFSDPIPSAQWTLLTYQHAAPPDAERLRVTIRKPMNGHALLGRLELVESACEE